ncbi:hypothetical protein [Candidatus Uabimicrobium amorphum]|uniref:Uncharacterized protein n=1 Tax=Uabimicrobium amorphum TaxID=2596890 RepID=A0A5S9IPE4_UABAM|nr:hypothetical protein [Candidatus Uabimicrobium amorphum]BBM84740.1 hypothetical protein UABAM_03101 [Candidatus Uabimicrobium amorphum]
MEETSQHIANNWISYEEIIAHFEDATQGLFFISADMIRRIIRLHKQLNVFYLSVPHNKIFTLPTVDFIKLLETYDSIFKEKILYQNIETEYVTLIALPSKRQLKKQSMHNFARYVWEQLFHAQIDIHCQKSTYLSDLTDTEIYSFFPPMVFEEIRAVLYQENQIFKSNDNHEVLQEFLAFYFQIRYFHKELLSSCFPSLEKYTQNIENIANAAQLNYKNLLESCRPQSISSDLHHSSDPTIIVKKILSHPHFIHEHQTRPQLVEQHQAFVTFVISQVVQQQKIIGKLRFSDIVNLAIREKVYVSKKLLLTLNELMIFYFAQNYTAATPTQKIMVSLRPRRKVIADKHHQKINKTTQIFLTQLSQCMAMPKPTLLNEIMRTLYGFIFYYILGGWFIHLCVRNLSLSFAWAMSTRYYFDKILFHKYYMRFLFVSHKKNIGRGILNLRQAQSILEHATYCCKLEMLDTIRHDLQQQYESYVKPVSEYLINDLNLDERDRADFQDFINYLSAKIRRERWSTERFILLDLENAYIDGNTKFCELSIRSWLFSFGKEKLITPLLYNGQMRRLKHLRSAYKKTQKMKLEQHLLEKYVDTVRKALDKTKQKISEQIKPVVTAAMEEQNFPCKTLDQKMAFHKVRQGYLNIIGEDGYSYFARLRDLVSRNRMALENLETKQVFTGDQLIKLDRLLGKKLRGIHRPAELYIHFLQIVSAMFFGTPTGRFMCKFFFFPFGGAVILMVLLQILLEHFMPNIDLISGPYILSTGVVLQLFFYVEHSRTWLKKFIWKPIKYVGTAPIQLLRKFPTVIQKTLILPFTGSVILFSALYFRFHREILLYKPAHWSHAYYYEIIYTACVVIAFIFFNSRLGIIVKNTFIEFIALIVQALGRGVLLRFLSFLLYLSRITLEKIEHASYIVSDYLRLIYGARYTTSLFKAIMALIWFPLAYIITLYIVLFLEPQINPLKFPIVSITYKLLLVFPEVYLQLIFMIQNIANAMLPPIMAYTFAWFTGFVFTGLFGFLSWELKENWQLYKENWRKSIAPNRIGRKGKTIVQFLRPGFHSGTIPHLFDKLRHARIKMQQNQRDFSPVLPLKREMEVVEHELKTYIKRDFILMLQMHPLFDEKFTIDIENVACTYNTIHTTIAMKNTSEVYRFTIYFQEKNNHLISTIKFSEGDIHNWSRGQQQVFAYLLAVFYKKSAVDFVREHIEFRLHKRYPDYKLYEELTYNIRANHMIVNLNQQNQKSMSLQNIRRKLFATKDIYQERMHFDRRIQFSKHNLRWKDFNKITEEQHFSRGDKYLHFIGVTR